MVPLYSQRSSMDAWSEGLRRAAVGSAAIQILTFNHICGDLPPPRAKARTRKKQWAVREAFIYVLAEFVRSGGTPPLPP